MKKIFSILLLSGVLANAGTHLISQKDKAFDKKEIKIKAGDTIAFKNNEKDVTHNVFSLGPVNEFELKSQAPGQTSEVKFPKAGTTDVECAIHPNMKLKVVAE